MADPDLELHCKRGVGGGGKWGAAHPSHQGPSPRSAADLIWKYIDWSRHIVTIWWMDQYQQYTYTAWCMHFDYTTLLIKSVRATCTCILLVLKAEKKRAYRYNSKSAKLHTVSFLWLSCMFLSFQLEAFLFHFLLGQKLKHARLFCLFLNS